MNAAAIAAIALSAVMLASVGAVPAHAQLPEPITLTPDKEEPYAAGETVTVTGEVTSPGQSSIPVAITVLAPNGNRVYFAQPSLDSDRMFEFTFTAGGPLWMEAGTYTVNASYGPISANAVRASTTIEFTGGAPAPTPPPVEPEPTGPEVDPDLAGLLSGIQIVGGEIVSIAKGVNTPSIIITINAEDDGMITVPMPRSVLDSRTEGQEGDDVPFSVLVNDEISDAEEVDTTPVARTLVIEFFAGDNQTIEIIGSFVIPEFGAVAVVILAAAIVAIVAIGSRSRLGIMPRY